jgi:hypothetical protein
MAPLGYEVTHDYFDEPLSEETRQMIHDASFQAWKGFFDQLSFTPARITEEQKRRVELGKRLRLIATDLELSGQEADARVIMEAAASLMRS